MDRRLIVVVDPNESTRELLAEVFRSELGAYVTELHAVSDLGPALHESVPDLVVAEIGMDRHGDVEAFRAVKGEHPHVPVLILTAWGTNAEVIEERIGAEHVIQKPFSLDEVIATARELMGARPPGGEAPAGPDGTQAVGGSR